MNKKLKKALYMFGFVLPIVAIPIITVACGTQTSQNTPKEPDKNQNEQTPKQETPIQDENKKVTVSSSLSSSKIYDESLLNSNVIELFKLFEEKSNLEKIKNYIEDISKNLDGLSILTTKELEKSSKTLEDFLNLINTSKIKSIKLKKIIEKGRNLSEAIAKTIEAIKKADKAAIAVTKVEDILEPNEILMEKLEPAEAPGELVKTLIQEDENEDINDETELEKAIKISEEANAVKISEEANAVKISEEAIKLVHESINEIKEEIEILYKKLFLNQSSFDITNFSKLKYNDFLSKFSEVKLVNFFSIENFKKHLQNLTDDNKLNDMALKDIFNSNINKLIDYFKKDQTNKEIKSDLIISNSDLQDSTNSLDKLIYNTIRENDPTIFEKIKDDLIKDLTQPENIKSLLDKLIFSDLFDVTKLQEKLNQ